MEQRKRIGFDIGDVMTLDLPKRRQADGSYSMPPPFESCLEALARIAVNYGPENLYVVSRAFETVSVEANWQLLRSWNFFERTRIPESNIHIYEDLPGDPSIKGRIATELGLTDFVDDKAKILDLLPPTVTRIYQFLAPHTQGQTVPAPVKRDGVTARIVESWDDLAHVLLGNHWNEVDDD